MDEALAVADRDEQRWRALPSRLGVYFVLALCLFRGQSAVAVLQRMVPVAVLSRLSALGWRLPSSTALTKVRDRVGVVPLELLFQALTRPTPTRTRSWSHAFGLQVCAWDGTEIAVADTAQNRDHFGRHRSTSGPCGAPKARVLVLLACGSRQVLAAAHGRLGQGETTLARQVVPHLRAGMLLLADRNFLGYRLWTAARGQGTHLLWRAKQDKPLLPAQHTLPDGSYLSTLRDPAEAAALRRNVARNRRRGHAPPRPRPITGITVRVIEALITVTVDGQTRTQPYRLVTSVLDPHTAPAEELVALYARRWAAETGIREIKTVLLAARPLRGTTPRRTLQELWATLIVYQVLRLLISRAALTADLDPSRIAFTAALNTATASITTTAHEARKHLTHTSEHLCRQLITRHSNYRIFPRARKSTPSRYPYRNPARQPTSTNASYRAEIRTPTPPRTSTQPQQPRAA